MNASASQKKKKNKITIGHTEQNIFEELLRFIYTGDVIGKNEIVDKQILAAEKYQIDDLKQECQDVLVNNILIDNCLD